MGVSEVEGGPGVAVAIAFGSEGNTGLVVGQLEVIRVTDLAGLSVLGVDLAAVDKFRDRETGGVGEGAPGEGLVEARLAEGAGLFDCPETVGVFEEGVVGSGGAGAGDDVILVGRIAGGAEGAIFINVAAGDLARDGKALAVLYVGVVDADNAVINAVARILVGDFAVGDAHAGVGAKGVAGLALRAVEQTVRYQTACDALGFDAPAQVVVQKVAVVALSAAFGVRAYVVLAVEDAVAAGLALELAVQEISVVAFGALGAGGVFEAGGDIDGHGKTEAVLGVV